MHQLRDFLTDSLFDWIGRPLLRRNLALPIKRTIARHLSESSARRQLCRAWWFGCHHYLIF
jgi:hypothetical protein